MLSTFCETMQRPHVIVNLAMSADGKISTRERRQVKISGKNDFSRVDRLKAECDAIMVGIGTVLADDPSLTVKSQELVAARTGRGLPGNPVRVVVDCRARTPLDAAILHRGPGRRIIACCEGSDRKKREDLSALAEVIVAGEREVDLPVLMQGLWMRGIRRLMVEGGGRLIGALFAAGLVDEFITFIGNIVIGGENAPTPADGPGFVREEDFPRLTLFAADRMDNGILLHWVVEKN
ncbi:MAG TPA: 2,5-diamino-6-(ribosylamino)-4(3H)-pyrimidinone 5'-phosphate reductase [Methanolinea sp.]|jgi:2,5-diamino-6-(ribosylamino)-4(3H)-pyrimidinone 5'-phosphate reductase|nr:2,5-diamino-6-(ribosylamino)-4(3H)-pyrimidinone 5'-phosphate reductase [Methanolinea sp.]